MSASRRSMASVAAGGVESLAFRVGEALLGVLLVVMTARFMAPEGRGLFALASLVALLCVLPLGPVWSASAVEVARRRAPLPELLGALLAIALAGGAATAAGALALAPVVGGAWWVVAFPAAIAPLLLVARYQEGVLQALGDVRGVNLMHLARAGLPVALLAAPLAAGASNRTVVAVWAASLVLLPLAFVAPVLRRCGGIAPPRDARLLRRLVRSGGRLLVANSAVLLNTRLALLVLAVFATTADVGVYSVAIAAAEVVYLASFALMSSTFRAIGSGAPDESLRMTARAVRHAVLLHVAGCALLVPLLYAALPAAVGDGYGAVPALLLVMAPGLVGQAGFWVLHTYFTVQLDRPGLIVRVAVAGLAANAVGAVALVPVMGLWGAAIAASAAGLVSATVAVRALVAAGGIAPRELMPGRAEIADYLRLVRFAGSHGPRALAR